MGDMIITDKTKSEMVEKVTTIKVIDFGIWNQELTAGQKISDIPEVAKFAQKTVPSGKKVVDLQVRVVGTVVSI